jgi:hypothetical protein
MTILMMSFEDSSMNMNSRGAGSSATQRLQAIALAAFGVLDLARGGFHWLAPDSGAGIVAGMNLHNAGGTNIVFLLAAVGIEQVAWGVLYLYVVLRRRSLLRLMFLLEILKSAAILFTEYVQKPPAPHVPGRFMHLATLIISVGMVLLPAKRDSTTLPAAG